MKRLVNIFVTFLLFFLIFISGCATEEISSDTDPFCGDNYCSVLESCSSCADDCGSCPVEVLSVPVTPKPMEKGIIRNEFSWEYEGEEYSFTMDFNEEAKTYYEDRLHNRNTDTYDIFVSDPYDDETITDLVEFLEDYASNAGLDKSEIPYFVVTFVQALPYTSDEVTTGYDEYVRYPFETLYDNGGDCEDTSILVAALLQEMDYGVVLLDYPGHIAVGVACSEDIYGSSYTYEGRRYCYLETTGSGWEIGQIPEEYDEAQIIPLYEKRPVLDVDFNYIYRYNNFDTYVDVNVTIVNSGSDTAYDVSPYVALQTSQDGYVWDDIYGESGDIDPERSISWTFTNLHVETGNEFRVMVQAQSDEYNSEISYGDWIGWN